MHIEATSTVTDDITI